MANVDIGRLAIEAPGLSPNEGHRLAQMVAEGLGGVRWTPIQADDMTVNVTASPGSISLERLAQLIIDELRRQLT
jgi:hypothetical protein